MSQAGRTTQQLAAFDGGFDDFSPDDAEVAQARRVVLQAHDGVVPIGIGRLGDVRRTRIRLGVRVAVHDAEHGKAAVVGGLLDAHVVLRVECVDDRGSGSIATRVKLERVIGTSVADQQTAHLLRLAGASVSDDLLLDLVGDHETL